MTINEMKQLFLLCEIPLFEREKNVFATICDKDENFYELCTEKRCINYCIREKGNMDKEICAFDSLDDTIMCFVLLCMSKSALKKTSISKQEHGVDFQNMIKKEEWLMLFPYLEIEFEFFKRNKDKFISFKLEDENYIISIFWEDENIFQCVYQNIVRAQNVLYNYLFMYNYLLEIWSCAKINRIEVPELSKEKIIFFLDPYKKMKLH